MVLDFWGNLCYYYGIRKLFRALSRSTVMVASAHLLKGGDKTEASGKLCDSARPEDEEKFPDDCGNRGEMPGMREAGKAVHPAGARQHGVFRHGWAVSSGKALDDILTREGILKDDNISIIRNRDGSRVFYDKEHPRAEIYIYEYRKEEDNAAGNENLHR